MNKGRNVLVGKHSKNDSGSEGYDRRIFSEGLKQPVLFAFEPLDHGSGMLLILSVAFSGGVNMMIVNLSLSTVRSELICTFICYAVRKG